MEHTHTQDRTALLLKNANKSVYDFPILTPWYTHMLMHTVWALQQSRQRQQPRSALLFLIEQITDWVGFCLQWKRSSGGFVRLLFHCGDRPTLWFLTLCSGEASWTAMRRRQAYKCGMSWSVHTCRHTHSQRHTETYRGTYQRASSRLLKPRTPLRCCHLHLHLHTLFSTSSSSPPLSLLLSSSSFLSALQQSPHWSFKSTNLSTDQWTAGEASSAASTSSSLVCACICVSLRRVEASIPLICTTLQSSLPPQCFISWPLHTPTHQLCAYTHLWNACAHANIHTFTWKWTLLKFREVVVVVMLEFSKQKKNHWTNYKYSLFSNKFR